MSYTPGPWKVSGDIIVGAPEPVPNPKVEPYGKSVAKIHWDFDGDCGAPEYRIKWKPEGESNARLIAAAPDLVDAIQFVADALAIFQANRNESCITTSIEHLQYALAKVRGDQ